MRFEESCSHLASCRVAGDDSFGTRRSLEQTKCDNEFNYAAVTEVASHPGHVAVGHIMDTEDELLGELEACACRGRRGHRVAGRGKEQHPAADELAARLEKGDRDGSRLDRSLKAAPATGERGSELEPFHQELTHSRSPRSSPLQ